MFRQLKSCLKYDFLKNLENVHLELAYQRAAEKAVQEDNCFKIYIYKRDCRVTIELLDTETEDNKKIDDGKKWSDYKERYADITNSENKPKSPVYLDRNLRLYKRRVTNNFNKNKRMIKNHQNQQNQDQDEERNKRLREESGSSSNKSNRNDGEVGDFHLLNAILKDRPPERNQTDHPGYEVNDETQCNFNMQDSKIMFTVTKDSYLYNISAFHKARKSHPHVTKQKGSRFRAWLKRWASDNVSDVQNKQCIDWLMGRGEGVVPNRTRVLTDNDLSRTPYVSYNKYRVEKLSTDDSV